MDKANTSSNNDSPDSVPVFRHRVMVADNSKIKFRELFHAFDESNIEYGFTNDNAKLVDVAVKFKPDIVVINLFLNSSSTLTVIRDLAKALSKQGTKIIVLTAHYSRENITECIRAGATDFILEPFETRLLLQRIRYQLQEREFISPEDLRAEPTQVAAGFQLVYECLKILAEVRELNRAVFECLKRIGELSKSTRVNIILGDVESSQGTIIAASDDATLQNRPVDLEKYPEVREVILNSSIVYIKDITQNPLTADIKRQVKSIEINSLLVFPIRHRGDTLGTLSIRLGRDNMEVSDKHLKTFYMIALSMGSKVAARKLLKRLEQPEGV
jgi:DNA-binding response OmpR family regulator